MKILDLPTGRVSLEFSPKERDVVFDAVLARCGRYDLGRPYELVTERGDRFAYMDEWDEPCLISTDPAGDAVLREIAAVRAKAAKIARPKRAIDSAPRLGHS